MLRFTKKAEGRIYEIPKKDEPLYVILAVSGCGVDALNDEAKGTGKETTCVEHGSEELKLKGQCSFVLDGCTPSQTECSIEQECGEIDDGCGNTIFCGNEDDVCDIEAGETCGGGVPHQCGNLPCDGGFYCQPCGAGRRVGNGSIFGNMIVWPTTEQQFIDDDPWAINSYNFCSRVQYDIDRCVVGPNICAILGGMAPTFCGYI